MQAPSSRDASAAEKGSAERAKSPLFAEERHRRILELLEESQKVWVKDLSVRFGLSDVTIRQDLRALERQGLLVRTHGGAIPVTQARFDLPTSQRESKRIEHKQAIAREALRLIDDGDTIILDAGTTVLQLARLLKAKRGLTVVVNDLGHIPVLQSLQGVEIIVLGGTFQKGRGHLVGPLATRVLGELYADKAFISTTGLTPARGLTTTDLSEAEVRAAMIANSKQAIVLADSSKIGKSCFASAAPLSQVDILITDWELPEKELLSLQRTGLKVIRAQAPPWAGQLRPGPSQDTEGAI
ncbi:DeoR/GlpR family DNA-binding transcription regulator [Geochorda subterranea]|uniref:DeoR/GlpR family DNA-binding transcription regulator n=1 Tax=Geochorda subterranea TaxID=3109564 RepID=A0ABZ1BLR4_9FIRM|nr:DeoR/GlpR family DNA-binding transcription regulator [Limnochorda sp. LNt]WRP13765.1 DeoR/GlpR family DNA-binding transcription regulator [Limnochorda sp. LNt]